VRKTAVCTSFAISCQAASLEVRTQLLDEAGKVEDAVLCDWDLLEGHDNGRVDPDEPVAISTSSLSIGAV